MAERSCLLVMDVQRGLVDAMGAGDLVVRLAGAVEAARAAGIPVVFVRVAFRPSHVEVSGRNAAFTGAAASGLFDDGTGATEVHPGLGVREGDIVVTKRRVSAFAGSDLDAVLRSLEVDRLVLGGLSSGGVVLSTLRQAADLDFALTVLADGCADPDPEVHRVLLEKVFPPQADVVTVEEWRATLAGG